MLNTNPETMNGGPYIYDPKSKKFMMRPSSEPQRQPLADAPDTPDEPSLPAARVKPPPSRERQKLVVRLASVALFLVWLALLALWTRQLSSRIGAPRASSSSAPSELPKEIFSK